MARTKAPPFGGTPPGLVDNTNANPNGFQNFQNNIGFLKHINQGGHIPLWVHPSVAGPLLAQHGQSGAVVPHPMIDLNDITA